MCVQLPENYSDVNTVVFAILPEDHLTYKLLYKNGKFCGSGIPKGKLVRVITLSEFEGVYLLGENSVRLQGNLNLTTIPEEKSLYEINAFLNNI